MAHVVVIGGSVAGLLAARAAADHVRQVTIVESADLGEPDSGRRREVPQATQLHTLLHMGRIQVERWFPGWSREVVGAGAVTASGEEICLYSGGLRKRAVPGYELLGGTRPLFEAHIRRRAFAHPRIVLHRGRVNGLVFDDPARPDRVSGIRYQAPDGEPGLLHADLVVDATGRNSRIARWLGEHGLAAPPVERLPIDIGYATALFRRGDELPGVRFVHALPGSARAGEPQPDTAAMTEVEDGRWMVVLANYASRRPAADPGEFVRRCRHLRAPQFGDVVSRCTMLGTVSAYRLLDSRRRHYVAMERLPGGLVAVGDALASFNPVYGQGMTTAALQAFCLERYLRGGAHPHEPALAYFRDAAVFVDAAWQACKMRDLSQPHIDGPYPRGYRIAQRIGHLVSRASVTDVTVSRRFLDVAHMVEHPRTMRSAGTILRAVAAAVAQRRGTVCRS